MVNDGLSVRKSVVARLSFLFVFAIVGLQSQFSYAITTVDYTGQLGQRNLLDSRGQFLSSGEVRLGVLAEDFDPETEAQDIERLTEAFTVLGTTAIRSIHGEPARFSGVARFDEPKLTGRKLYLWVVETVDGAEGWNTFENVTEHGLFSSSDLSWRVPSGAVAPPVNSVVIHSSQIDELFGQGTLAPLSLKTSPVVLPGLDYATWADAVFPADLLEDETLPGADADGDGIVNVLEQFSGTDPLKADATPYDIRLENDAIVVTYTRSKTAPIGSAFVEISEDLTEWKRTASESSVVEDLGDAERVRSVVRPDASAAFLRLSVRMN